MAEPTITDGNVKLADVFVILWRARQFEAINVLKAAFDDTEAKAMTDQSGSDRVVAQVLSLMDAQERDLNDVGPWGAGYRQAMTDLRKDLRLRFGNAAFDEEGER